MFPKLVMTVPGPVEGHAEADVPFTMTMNDEAAGRARRVIGGALIASEAGDTRPLIGLLKKRPEVMSISVIQEEVYGRWRNDKNVRAAAEGRRGRGRPAVSDVSPHILFYVAKVSRDEKLDTPENALHWISCNKARFPFGLAFDSLKAAYYRARDDYRFQPLLLLDLPRSEFIAAAAAEPPERR